MNEQVYTVTLSLKEILELNAMLAKAIFNDKHHPVLGGFRTIKHNGVLQDGKRYYFAAEQSYDPTDGLSPEEKYKEYGLARYDEVREWATKAFPGKQHTALTNTDLRFHRDETDPIFVRICLDLADPALSRMLLQEHKNLPKPPKQLERA